MSNRAAIVEVRPADERRERIIVIVSAAMRPLILDLAQGLVPKAGGYFNWTFSFDRESHMKLLTAAAVALLLGSSANVLADDSHHPPAARTAPVSAVPAAQMGSGGEMMGMMSMMRCPMMGGHTEGALAFLKAELKIADRQNDEWSKFADAYRVFAASKPAGMMQGGQMMGGGTAMGPGAKPSMPYPARMKDHLQMMQGHLVSGQKFQSAVDGLYGALSSDQKKTADELLPMFTMMGGKM